MTFSPHLAIVGGLKKERTFFFFFFKPYSKGYLLCLVCNEGNNLKNQKESSPRGLGREVYILIR